MDNIVANEAPILAHLRAKHRELGERIEQLSSEARLRVLREAQVVGCTTNS